MTRLRTDRWATTTLLGTAVLGKLLGCAALALVLAGLGVHLDPATMLLIYMLTIMAALVGPLPGGIGVADASLGALLIANGVPAAAAAGAVIAFRLLDLWMPLAVGAIAGTHQWRRRAPVDPVVEVPGISEAAPDPTPAPLLVSAFD
jgi:uncharacterized protein (TIRG00374 family)